MSSKLHRGGSAGTQPKRRPVRIETASAKLTTGRSSDAWTLDRSAGESDAMIEHAGIGRQRRRGRAGSLVGSGTRSEAERDEQRPEAAHERTAYTDFSIF